MKVTPNRSLKKLPTKANASSKTKSSDATSKKTAQQIILELVAEAHSLGESLPRIRLTQGTGIATKTATNNLAKLKQKGWIDYDAETVRLTLEGIKAAGPLANPPTTNGDRHERLKKSLKGKQVKLFDLLADGSVHDRDTVAQALDFDGMKQKGFVNLVGALRGQGIVEYPDNKTVQLTDMCFPFGRKVED